MHVLCEHVLQARVLSREALFPKRDRMIKCRPVPNRRRFFRPPVEVGVTSVIDVISAEVGVTSMIGGSRRNLGDQRNLSGSRRNLDDRRKSAEVGEGKKATSVWYIATFFHPI